tara:strand:- start:154 stop:471 length:318 start_codon:yes stop_codon:yes gene_type:complete
MVSRELGMGIVGVYGGRKNSKDVSKRQRRYSSRRSYAGSNKNGKRGKKQMSMLSKAIDRYIAKKVSKYGAKGAIIWFIEQLVKRTPTKEDDKMFAKVKEFVNEFK